MNQITLRESADAVVDIMHSLNYSISSICQYRKHFEDFIDYCNEKGITQYDGTCAIAYAGMKTGKELSDLSMPSCKENQKYIVLLRSLRLLGEYSRTQTFTSRFVKFMELFDDNHYWRNIYTLFMNYLKNDCDYAESTIVHKELTIRLVIHILIQREISCLDNIDKEIIETIVSQFIHDAPKSVTHRIGEMKQFFQYCFDHSLSKENISFLIPDVSIPHETKIPASWSAEEVKQLLDSIDRSGPSGKRDYAILLIACRLGLRSVDLVNLELSDFNWEGRSITIRQKKTRNTITLPLLNDIGWAVIDYIKNGRPETDDKKLFISLNAPYSGFTKGGSLDRIFVKRAHEAGLNLKRFEKCGMHSLRHTLGSVMLEKGTPLPAISQILGHCSVKSTETYLRINLDGLNECPIDPEKMFDHEL